MVVGHSGGRVVEFEAHLLIEGVKPTDNLALEDLVNKEVRFARLWLAVEAHSIFTVEQSKFDLIA